MFVYSTTWDEHIMGISVGKHVTLGHIDFKFSLYQQCPNPPAIQITLLKQNTSGFGYRMKKSSGGNYYDVGVSAYNHMCDNIFEMQELKSEGKRKLISRNYFVFETIFYFVIY